jgi:hypothetical protein
MCENKDLPKSSVCKTTSLFNLLRYATDVAKYHMFVIV